MRTYLTEVHIRDERTTVLMIFSLTSVQKNWKFNQDFFKKNHDSEVLDENANHVVNFKRKNNFGNCFYHCSKTGESDFRLPHYCSKIGKLDVVFFR